MFYKVVKIPNVGKNNIFHLMQIEFSSDDIKLAEAQAKIKSQFTADVNQNNIVRDERKKLSKQLSGCLSEMAVDYYLQLIALRQLKNEGVYLRIIRYDNVRTDGFETSSNEYDLKILLPIPNNEINICVRSSLNFKDNISDGIAKLNIVGPYTNKAKTHEDLVDFYIQPIFQYKNPKANIANSEIDFYTSFMNGLFDLYIVGGCSYETMLDDSIASSGNLGQFNTNYQLVRIKNASDYLTLGLEIEHAIKSKLKRQ